MRLIYAWSAGLLTWDTFNSLPTLTFPLSTTINTFLLSFLPIDLIVSLLYIPSIAWTERIAVSQFLDTSPSNTSCQVSSPSSSNGPCTMWLELSSPSICHDINVLGLHWWPAKCLSPHLKQDLGGLGLFEGLFRLVRLLLTDCLVEFWLPALVADFCLPRFDFWFPLNSVTSAFVA